MVKLLLVLFPLTVFAQVEIDTVIRLPSAYLGRGCFIPELNKLYVIGDDYYYVLDCSTYQWKAQIPRGYGGLAYYSWNWRRQKLYVSANPRPESTFIIDASADTVMGLLVVGHEDHTSTYVSNLDQLYKPSIDTLYAFDCAADTVARRILPPLPGYGLGYTTLDSTDHKLYVGMAGDPQLLGVYDYVADSFVKFIDVSSIPAWSVDALVLNHANRKGYLAGYQVEPWAVNLGIVDTEHDTLIGVLPVRIWNGVHTQVAVDERDGKVYIADNDADPETPDTLWVVDCATDSVLKKVEYESRGWGPECIRWVPWSNRLYLSLHDWSNSSVTVLDCNTDSIIARLQLGIQVASDLQLDPVRERIFAIRADSGTIHVLRDVEGGVAEEPASARPALIHGLHVQTTPGGFDVRYSVASPCRVDLSVYDLMGREVRRLVAEQQSAGQHSVVWNYQDLNGHHVALGVYFIQLRTPAAKEEQKVVVTR